MLSLGYVQVHFGESQPSIEPTNGTTAAEEKVKHRVSGPAQKTEKGRKVARVVPKKVADS